MVDSHAHLADEAFAADVDVVLQRARDAALAESLCIVDASDPEECARAARVLPLWDRIRTTAGVHPHRAAALRAAARRGRRARRRQDSCGTPREGGRRGRPRLSLRLRPA